MTELEWAKSYSTVLMEKVNLEAQVRWAAENNGK
jgi:hypothetical protein